MLIQITLIRQGNFSRIRISCLNENISKKKVLPFEVGEMVKKVNSNVIIKGEKNKINISVYIFIR
jgi:hypothetical protein